MSSSRNKKKKQRSDPPKESGPALSRKERALHPLMAGFIVAGALLAVVVGLRLLPRASLEERVEAIIASEQLLLSTIPDLKRLDKSAMNLKLPDHRSLGLFADEVRVRLYELFRKVNHKVIATNYSKTMEVLCTRNV